MSEKREIRFVVNGTAHAVAVEPRVHLADVLRHQLSLTGTHIGCEHGVCGACTVLLDGATVRSCLLLAVQADGCSIETIEGVAEVDGALHPIQSALAKHHGLQCGYCTPGVVMTLIELQRELAGDPIDETAIRHALAGNLCRCTGYQGMVDAALAVLNPPAEAGIESSAAKGRSTGAPE